MTSPLPAFAAGRLAAASFTNVGRRGKRLDRCCGSALGSSPCITRGHFPPIRLVAAQYSSAVPTRLHSTTGGIGGDDGQPERSAHPASERIRDEKARELRSNSRLSLAPMMEYTDRHFRHLVRLLSGRTLLYTEMVAANAISHERADAIDRCSVGEMGKAELKEDVEQIISEAAEEVQYDASYLRRFLGQSSVSGEVPSVLQLGGSDPAQLALATRCVSELTDRGYCDYTALNLNCGCPSPKVAGKGCFGAALMEEPTLVRDLTQAMHEGCGGSMPVTVKCRIGTDGIFDEDVGFTVKRYQEIDAEAEYAKLRNFIETVASNGIVTDFQVHARIAVLGKSFSPADNRKVPPLKYDFVRRLVGDYPELTFSLNGGVETLGQVRRELEECPGLAGVMVGRAWAADPWSFATADSVLYGDDGGDATAAINGGSRPRNRLAVLQAYGRHADAEEREWDPIKMRRFIVKAVSQLFAGEPNAKRYRIALDEIGGMPKRMAREGMGPGDMPPVSELILDAASRHLSEEVLLRTPEESYDMRRWEEERRRAKKVAALPVDMTAAAGQQQQQQPSGGAHVGERGLSSAAVSEWQDGRKAGQAEHRGADEGAQEDGVVISCDTTTSIIQEDDGEEGGRKDDVAFAQ